MTDRKRTVAIQVRVTEQEKWRMELQPKRCGMSLPGYLRQVGAGKAAAAFPSQRFHELFYRQVNSLRRNLTTQSMEQTAFQLDERMDIYYNTIGLWTVPEPEILRQEYTAYYQTMQKHKRTA